ncbi:prepilin-type N-terminal cleavage/methylation domain-containing protein [Pseudoalteromonas piscicida]|nr:MULTISPECIES: prepilin-type N-terminal cleavage/methylation domain-containing protein [Pseudoalteromonas]WPU34598.1 prepilin-type N-terminal cleavage/methylation domain-containing protein [Pseudoalteromonas piscicida]
MRSGGFTLVEILVSVVILVTTITGVSMIYRGALVSSEKAQSHVAMAAKIPAILHQAQKQIRAAEFNSTQLSDQTTLGQVSYEWQANTISKKEIRGNNRAKNESMIEQNLDYNEYKLWRVNLTVKFKGAQEQFEFYEVSWKYASR